MRLRKLNQLVMVAVSSTLAGMTASTPGCKQQPPPRAIQPMPMLTTATMPSTQSTTAPSTEPAMQPIVMPLPTPATAPAVAVNDHLPDAAPTTAPMTLSSAIAPAIQATTVPAAEPATQPVVVPMPVSTPATSPAVAVNDHLPNAAPTTPPVIIPATISMATTAPSTPPARPVVAVPVAPPTKDAAAPTAPDEIEADAALAERFASIAELSIPLKVSNTDAWPFLWQQQAALYSAATALNPLEGRYARLTADAAAQTHDIDGEIKALFLATRAKFDDEFSWNKRLDLMLSRMQSSEADVKTQSAGAQIKYLRAVMDSKEVPADVRSHAGFRSAQILIDRGQDAAASTVLEEALRYDPSNIECLQLRYTMLPASATRYERAGRLLDLLRANPLQWQYSAQVAEIAAGSGLIQQSAPWYLLAVSSAHQQGVAAQGTMLNMAAAFYIADRKLDASRTVTALLDIDPKFYPAWFMQLLLDRSSNNKDAVTKTLQLANNAMSNRVVEVVNKIAPTATNKPTTRPLDSDGTYPMPDLGPVAAKLKAGETPESKQPFIEAVADLARLQIYFAQQPAAALPLLDALRGVLPDNDPLLAQLQGWNDVLANKSEDARAKLTSIATDDPLAQLGLIKLMNQNPESREQAESISRKLIQDNPSGLVGAMIWEGLRSERVKMILTSQAVALQQELDQFPLELLNAGEKPQALYSIHASPLFVGRYFGDPLLAEVTIQNLTNNDLTIGNDGLIKPQLLFNMTAKSAAKPLDFQAIDNLASPTTIKGHGYTEQTVRVDQSQMLSALSDPDSTNTALNISGVVSTNETAYRLGGYPSSFTKAYYRMASPVIATNLDSTVANVATGQPAQKITSLTLLELFVQKLQKVKTPDGSANKAIPMLMDALNKARGDTIPAVAAWATKCDFELSEGDDRAGVVRDLAEDADWRHRQLALSLLSGVDESVRKQVLAKLAVDPQSSVRAEAIAVQGLMKVPDQPPTTAP